ncbi:hypothetical protein B0A50_01719 [Salinomyces thailandicus]|uniref:Uncharacterized protein n=1 Tax=Salinomyces thailandicus TaxID=706561 RepID=A0A4U0UAC6_9PEZI|nr:hypothetical protein B0A50_01719 [Salinomyces thailandica]
MFLPEQSSNSTTFHTPAFADNKTKDEDTIFGSLATVLAVVGIIVAIAVAYLQNRQFNNNLPLHVWNAYREFREFEAFELRVYAVRQRYISVPWTSSRSKDNIWPVVNNRVASLVPSFGHIATS